MFKLTSEERSQILNAIKDACSGTELQDLQDFASQYLGTYVIALVENRDSVFPRSKKTN